MNAYRTDLILTDKEEQALTLIGEYLFKLRLQDWQECKAKKGKELTARKQTLNKLCGDRYAYTICQLNNQQYQLQKRNIAAEIKLLQKEQNTFDEREKKSVAWLKAHPDIVDENGKKPAKKDYNPLAYDDYVRRDRNKKRLERISDGWYDVTFGGKSNHRRLMRAIQRDGIEAHADEMAAFKKTRYNIKAIGDSSSKFGNAIVRIDDTWHLSIRVPDELRQAFIDIMGVTLREKEHPVLRIEAPVIFRYGADKIHANIVNGKAVTSDITFTGEKWIISTVVNSSSDDDNCLRTIASREATNGGVHTHEDKRPTFAAGDDNPGVIARRTVNAAKTAKKKDIVRANFDAADCADDVRRKFAARGARFAGVDVNAGHIDVAVCDVYGNLVGKPKTVYFNSYRSEKQNKSSVLHALDVVKHFCERRRVECVFFEDLKGFLDSRSRTLNDGGHVFRRCVSLIPTGQIKDWAVRKLTSDSCHVEFVAAAYTSQCAAEFWIGGVSSSSGSGGSGSVSSFVVFSGVHQAAALMIARRGLGLGLFRRFVAGSGSSCVTDSVGCCDNRTGATGGLGAGGACEGAVVSGSSAMFREVLRRRVRASSDHGLDSSSDGSVLGRVVRRVPRRHHPC